MSAPPLHPPIGTSGLALAQVQGLPVGSAISVDDIPGEDDQNPVPTDNVPATAPEPPQSAVAGGGIEREVAWLFKLHGEAAVDALAAYLAAHPDRARSLADKCDAIRWTLEALANVSDAVSSTGTDRGPT